MFSIIVIASNLNPLTAGLRPTMKAQMVYWNYFMKSVSIYLSLFMHTHMNKKRLSCKMKIQQIYDHFNVELRKFVNFLAKCMQFDKTIGEVLICLGPSQELIQEVKSQNLCTCFVKCPYWRQLKFHRTFGIKTNLLSFSITEIATQCDWQN